MSYPDFDLVWYIPGILCGGMRPRTLADIECLAAAGIRNLVCLKETASWNDELHGRGIILHHFPVPDFSVPDPAVIGRVGTLLENDPPVFIHCHAGLGRTGTVAAALLVRWLNLTPEEALERVRGLRPGSVETADQERFVLSLRAQADHVAPEDGILPGGQRQEGGAEASGSDSR